MSRYTLSKCCAELGCKEVAFFGYDTQRELRESTYRNRDWLCVRHANPEEVLSPQNATTEHVVTAIRSDDLGKNFWDTRSGFTFGPGFKAFADDFPEGTRLVITARVELPDAAASNPVPAAWMHEFRDPHTGERRREPRLHKPNDCDLLPGDTVRPLVYTSS